MKRGLTLIELVVVVGIVLILVALVTSSVSSVISRAEERKTRTAMSLFQLAIKEYESSTGRRLTMSARNNISNSQGRPFDMRRAELHAFTTAEISRVLLRHQPSADILGRIDPSLIGILRTGTQTPSWLPSGLVNPACSEPDPRALSASSAQSAFIAFASAPYDPLNSPYTGLNSLVLLDSWGSPVRAVHPGPEAYIQADGNINTSIFPIVDMFGDAAALTPDPDGTVSRRVEGAYIGQPCPNTQIVLVSAGPNLKFGDKRESQGECFTLSLDNIIDNGDSK